MKNMILQRQQPLFANYIIQLCAHLIRAITHILYVIDTWQGRLSDFLLIVETRSLIDIRTSPSAVLYVCTHASTCVERRSSAKDNIRPDKGASACSPKGLRRRAEETHPEYRARRDSHPWWRGIRIDRQWISKRASSTCVSEGAKNRGNASCSTNVSGEKLRLSLSDRIALKSVIGEIRRGRDSRLPRERINYSKYSRVFYNCFIYFESAQFLGCIQKLNFKD